MRSKADDPKAKIIDSDLKITVRPLRKIEAREVRSYTYMSPPLLLRILEYDVLVSETLER